MRIYADEDGARKEEIAALAQPDTGSFSNFYDRLKDIKDYYRRFPTTDVTEVRIAWAIEGGLCRQHAPHNALAWRRCMVRAIPDLLCQSCKQKILSMHGARAWH